MNKVIIPSSLRKYVDGQRTVEVDAPTVGEAIQSLASLHPDIESHLWEPDGRLALHLNVFVNDGNIRDRNGLDTELIAGDEIILLAAMAGG